MASTRGKIVALGKAQLLARFLQLFTPMLLVRLLDVDDFGAYRYFWLFVNTVMVFAPLGLPRSLYYFLSRESAQSRFLYVNHAFLFLLSVGIVVAIVIGPWNPLQPSFMQGMPGNAYVLPLFIVFWAASFLIEVLPAADENVRWQSNATMSLALIRSCLVLGAAWYTRDIEYVLLVLLFYAAFRLVLLFWYLCKKHSCRFWVVKRPELQAQLKYAIPFGVSTGLQSVRSQVDLWVVAALFQTGTFAVFSVAGLASQLLEVVRSSVVNVILPRMNRAHAQGDVKQIVFLNSSSNLAIGGAILPLLAFLFMFSGQVISFLFTDAYVQAAPAMRMYLVGMAILSIEMTSVLSAFNQGVFVMRLGMGLFMISVLGSYFGAVSFGITGAALGTVLSIGADSIFKLNKVCRISGMSLRKVQDWRGIATVLGCSAVAVLPSVLLVRYSGVTNQFLLLFAAAAIFVCVYLALLVATGYKWLILAYLGKETWRRPPAG